MKREWHMNLKTVTAKHLKMEFKNHLSVAHLFTEVLIISWHTEIWNRLCGKNQGYKIKDSGEPYDFN